MIVSRRLQTINLSQNIRNKVSSDVALYHQKEGNLRYTGGKIDKSSNFTPS
jgi:hypothetical protein